jgi:RNA polymerase sigma-70 factor, ECF subfamily
MGALRGRDGCGGEGGHVQNTVDLIEAEIPRLRRYARYLAREADRADDLVQECLMRAIAKVDSWTPGTNLRAWLFVILRNCHINEVRRGQRTVLMGETSIDYDVVPTPASQEAHISLLEVRDAYLNLSEEHREVLLLVAIEGLQYEEAAAILEIPVGTIRSRLSRARQALRDALDDGREIAPGGSVTRARGTRHG